MGVQNIPREALVFPSKPFGNNYSLQKIPARKKSAAGITRKYAADYILCGNVERVLQVLYSFATATLTYLLKQSCCSRLCTSAPSIAGSRFCEWKLLRLLQLGKRPSAFPRMEAGVSQSSSKGRYVSSTPFRTATYCLSELSMRHQSR